MIQKTKEESTHYYFVVHCSTQLLRKKREVLTGGFDSLFDMH